MTPIAPQQRGPHVWTGSELTDESMWSWQLDEADVDALIHATAQFADKSLEDLPTEIPPIEMSLELKARLGELRQTLIAGRGFELIRGLPVEQLSPGQAAAIFMSLGALVGSSRPQNSAGDLLGNVRNVGVDAVDPTVRIYQTSERQTFHTDSADVVGLLCLQDAASGGESLLVSVAAVYNKMLAVDMHLAHLLFEPVATDRRGETAPGQKPFFDIPVLNWFDEKLTVIYQRQYIDSAQRFGEATKLTSEMTAALDLFDEIANSPDIHLRMQLRPGDIQMVHNHSLLHDRTGFVDRPNDPRHLLRLWLTVLGDRQLPEVFTSRYGSTTVGDRGGVL